jgi:hypothetical protein
LNRRAGDSGKHQSPRAQLSPTFRPRKSTGRLTLCGSRSTVRQRNSSIPRKKH